MLDIFVGWKISSLLYSVYSGQEFASVYEKSSLLIINNNKKINNVSIQMKDYFAKNLYR